MKERHPPLFSTLAVNESVLRKEGWIKREKERERERERERDTFPLFPTLPVNESV